MTLHLALDTSVLHGPPRFDGAHFRALDRLVELRAISILVPELVYRELASQLIENRKTKLLAVNNALAEARRWCIDPNDAKKLDEARIGIAAVQRQQDEALITRPLRDWVTHTSARILPLEPDHTRRALERYFTGSPPFRKPRAREDLPDGLIFEILRDAAAAFPGMRLVCADSQLCEAAAKVLGLVCYPNLKEYLASEEVLAVIKAANASENLSSLRDLLLRCTEFVGSQIRGPWVRALAQFKFESQSIPEDNNEATIQSIDDPTHLEIVAAELAYLGDGSVLVPVAAECEIEVYYCVSKADYYCLSDKRVQSMSTSDWSDHYYMVTETLSATVRASLAIDLPGVQLDADDLSAEALVRALQQASFEIDGIESVEINGSDEAEV